MALVPLTGTASVVNGDATVVVSDMVLTPLNCQPGTAIVLNGATYFVLSRTDTSTLELTRAYAAMTSGSVPCEISQITADGVSTAVANARLADLLAQLAAIEANGLGLFFLLGTGTADADPGDGRLTFNNPDPAAATAIYIDNLDASGSSIAGEIDTWDDGTSAKKGTVYVRDIADRSVVHVYALGGAVGSASTYRKLTSLTHVAGTGSFGSDGVMVFFAPKGDKGDAGAAGTNGTNGTSGVITGGSAGTTDNRLLRADGTGGATIQNSPITVDDSGNMTGVAGITASGAVSGATVAGAMVATQAQQETGAATNLVVTPGRQHFHPSAAKAWCSFNVAGAIGNSFNITSVTDNGTGTWTVNIATDFSDQYYAAGAAGGYKNAVGYVIYNAASQAAGTFTVIATTGGATTDPDTTSALSFWAFGDQP